MGKKSREKEERKRIGEEIELYTVNEAAELLRVHPVTVRDWIKAGKMKSVKLGIQQKRNYIRIERTELQRILEGR